MSPAKLHFFGVRFDNCLVQVAMPSSTCSTELVTKSCSPCLGDTHFNGKWCESELARSELHWTVWICRLVRMQVQICSVQHRRGREWPSTGLQCQPSLSRPCHAMPRSLFKVTLNSNIEITRAEHSHTFSSSETVVLGRMRALTCFQRRSVSPPGSWKVFHRKRYWMSFGCSPSSRCLALAFNLYSIVWYRWYRIYYTANIFQCV